MTEFVKYSEYVMSTCAQMSQVRIVLDDSEFVIVSSWYLDSMIRDDEMVAFEHTLCVCSNANEVRIVLDDREFVTLTS